MSDLIQVIIKLITMNTPNTKINPPNKIKNINNIHHKTIGNSIVPNILYPPQCL